MSAKYNFSGDRYKDYDYSSSGIYYVTINVRDKRSLFGIVEKGRVILSASGKLAEACWRDIPYHFKNIMLGDFVTMPEHVHGLIIIEKLFSRPVPEENSRSAMSSLSPKAGSLGVVIRSFKSATTKYIHEFDPSFEWQSGYYDHIVRNFEDLQRIQNYITGNPANYNPRDKDSFES